MCEEAAARMHAAVDAAIGGCGTDIMYRVKAVTLRPSFGAFSLLYCAGSGIDPRPRRFRNFYENFAERGSQSDRLHPVIIRGY